MINLSHLLPAITLTISLTSPLAAQSVYQQISNARQCNQALEAGQNDEAQRIAEDMLVWSGIVSNAITPIKRCVEGVFGGEYEVISGKILPLADVEKYRTEKNVEIAENFLARIFPMALESYENANASIVTKEIHQACISLHKTDAATTMVNPVCVESFMQNGHPNLAPFESFFVEQAINFTENLNQRELEIINKLTEDEVRMLCADRESLCNISGISNIE